MDALLQFLPQVPEYARLLEAIRMESGPVSLYGMAPVHRAHFTAALLRDLPDRHFCLLFRDEPSARTFAADLESLAEETPVVLPCRDFVFHPMEGASHDYEQQRLRALYTLQTGESRVLCAPADGMMLGTMPPDALKNAAVLLRDDGQYDVQDLCARLIASGYTRGSQVEGPGQFALRGGILDVFPAGAQQPVRAEFFGDEIDSLGIFDPMTQRRSRSIREAVLLPTREVLPHLAPGGIPGLFAAMEKQKSRKHCSDTLRQTLTEDQDRLKSEGLFAAADRYLPLIYPTFHSAFSYLPADTVYICCDTPAVLECAKGLTHRQSEDITHLLEDGVLAPSKSGYAIDDRELVSRLEGGVVLMDSFLTATTGFSPKTLLSLNAKQLPAYGGSLDTALRDLKSYLDLGYTIFALTGGKVRAQSLTALLNQHELPCVADAAQAESGKVCVLPLALSAGMEYPLAKIAILCEGQPAKRPRTKKANTNRDHLKSFSDLHPGDLVVHQHHGIGRFVGVERIQVEKVWRDYMKIAFAGTDFVYVPATALDLVSKYIGAADTAAVKLSKLGGNAWQKTKQRAKKAALDLAEGLIKLYAQRQKQPGFAFLPDDDWQRGFEEAFPYEETEDQLVCAQEIKRDMQRPHPMDRLLCGDVGFGKTEVAFRAIMKCILSGKQAAILVPTTVLARQHYISAVQRFSGYPIKIEMMSRFRTQQQLAETARHAKNGSCDLLIGTHRILQKDVNFKRLGLLVIDEEQRFGVAHKERIKQLAPDIDVLTLSATPIPRTLNMALSGIRDMSVLEEPPMGRQPVQTYVLEHNDAVIRDAIRRELNRGGQVYYLHNRIDSISNVAKKLQDSFPDAVVAVAHGRMGEEAMSDVMSRMYAGEVSILVCTTIIETGVDIANVNTLIIEDADYMGLAQLHQIRGRVGRSSRHAYAYLTYRRGKTLTEVSQKRLSAIREFAEFGSGFKIAMRDLEIRGAGNVLGAEQSGHMMDVGYDMYLQLLEEATGELKGEPPVKRTDCAADILVSAGLPQHYVEDAATRVDLYRRIAMITDKDDYMDLQDELLDRFGDLPASAQALLDIALLRANATAAGVSEISQKNGSLQVFFAPEAMEGASRACDVQAFRSRILLTFGARPCVTLKLKPGEDPLDASRKLIDAFGVLSSPTV